MLYDMSMYIIIDSTNLIEIDLKRFQDNENYMHMYVYYRYNINTIIDL